VLLYGVLPGLALVLAIAAGILKWKDSAMRDIDLARIKSDSAAKDSTIALLTCGPGTTEKDVAAARERLTGGNARQNHVTAVADVPAVASVPATPNHAVVLVFADQTVTAGTSPPTDVAAMVRVTLDKIEGRWLIFGFDQVPHHD